MSSFVFLPGSRRKLPDSPEGRKEAYDPPGRDYDWVVSFLIPLSGVFQVHVLQEVLSALRTIFLLLLSHCGWCGVKYGCEL